MAKATVPFSWCTVNKHGKKQIAYHTVLYGGMLYCFLYVSIHSSKIFDDNYFYRNTCDFSWSN